MATPDVEAWREWFAKAVQPRLDKMRLLDKPCPCCGVSYAEPDSICAYCFLCHGRGHCGCEDEAVR
jgi:uncharacterized OB-fold protein